MQLGTGQFNVARVNRGAALRDLTSRLLKSTKMHKPLRVGPSNRKLDRKSRIVGHHSATPIHDFHAPGLLFLNKTVAAHGPQGKCQSKKTRDAACHSASNGKGRASRCRSRVLSPYSRRARWSSARSDRRPCCGRRDTRGIGGFLGGRTGGTPRRCRGRRARGL